MSALRKATRRESDAYQAMVDAQADVIARVLAGLDDDVTDRMRRASQARRREWLAAARLLEDVTVREWDFEDDGVTERRRYGFAR